VIAELISLLGFSDVLQLASGRRFFVRKLFYYKGVWGSVQRNLELKQVFGRPTLAISEVYNVTLPHVVANASVSVERSHTCLGREQIE